MATADRKIDDIRATGAAFRLTREFGFTTPQPIPVEDIAMDNGILCLEGQLTGCLARLVRKKRGGIIRTQAGIRESGRRRFAIAHELGHWFLHESESQFFLCTEENMRDYQKSPMEAEANIFASELLMPTAAFRPLVERTEPRLQNIADMALRFGTSLTATALRYIKSSRHECIVVSSKYGCVTWAMQKDSRSGLYIEKGQPLHRDSLTYHCLKERCNLDPDVVPATAWFTNPGYGRSVEISEECWFQEEYQQALTLLVITDADSEEPDAVDRFQRRGL